MITAYQHNHENNNCRITAADRHHQWDDQQSRGEKEAGQRQVQRRLSQIIGRSCTVVKFTEADEVVVHVAVFEKMAKIESNGNSVEQSPAKRSAVGRKDWTARNTAVLD